MAFPTINAQQGEVMNYTDSFWGYNIVIPIAELNNRKILEDLQIKKNLLQKGVGPVSTIPGIINSNPLSMPLVSIFIFTSQCRVVFLMCYIFQLMQTGIQQQTDSVQNNSSRTAWNLATNQSSGFFVPQDSVFGNNILPVLPRFDNPPK